MGFEDEEEGEGRGLGRIVGERREAKRGREGAGEEGDRGIGAGLR